MAAANAFVREYLHANTEQPTLAGFREWTIDRTSGEDVVFASLVSTVFIILPMLELMEKAMRNNHLLAYWVALLTLIPLLLLRNNIKYVPMLLRERAIYQYLCHKM
jgi:hypothetical protein